MARDGMQVPSELQRPGLVTSWLDADARLPLMLRPERPAALRTLDAEVRACVRQALPRIGAVLFRGFAAASPAEFSEFVRSFGDPLLPYEFGSTPRREIAPGVYSASEYAPTREIPLHNEQSYTSHWPARIWFYCATPASSGGATPIADSHAVYLGIPEPIVELFKRRDVLYARNYGSALDVSWQRVFGHDDPEAVLRFCAERGIECEFDALGHPHTRQRRPAVIDHPSTGQPVWFNQAHLFHVSSLEPVARASLLAMGVRNLPRQAYFGDGGELEPGALEAIRLSYKRCSVSICWELGDVLLLDNVAVAHGRQPFKGPRTVHVALT